MRLKGSKIIVRDLSFGDINDFFEYVSDPKVGPDAGWKPVPNMEIARRILSSHIISKEVYGLELPDSGKLIGTISIYNGGIRKYKYVKQLGFSIASAYWGQGITTEAVQMVIKYVFESTDCEVLEVGHHSDNFGSKRVIEKCGFNYDGRLCKFKKLFNDRVIDADFYSMTREDYERMKKYE